MLINMDDLMASSQRAEGFRGQKVVRVPEQVRYRCENLLVSISVVTDLGMFDAGPNHRVERSAAISEHVLIIVEQGQGWVEIESPQDSATNNATRRYAVTAPPSCYCLHAPPHRYGADKGALAH